MEKIYIYNTTNEESLKVHLSPLIWWKSDLCFSQNLCLEETTQLNWFIQLGIFSQGKQ